MKRLASAACVLILLSKLTGCGSGGSSADSLMKEQIKLMNELAEAMESGADQSKVEALNKKLNETAEKFKALKLSEDDTKKLAEKYKDDLGKAVMRLMAASFKGPASKMGDIKVPDPGGFGGTPTSKEGGQGETKK